MSPEIRHTLSGVWTYGDWKVAANVNYKKDTIRNIYLGSFYADEELYLQYKVDPQIRVNTSVTYSGFFNTDITLGVQNLLNDPPPVDPFDAVGTTSGVYDATPRFWYVRLERQF